MSVDNNVIRILAIDPGLNFTGWCILDKDTISNTITVIKADTVRCSTLIDKSQKGILIRFKKQFVILYYYYFFIKDLIETYLPDAVVSEGAFMHSFVNAFASLTLAIHTIRRASYDTLGADIIVLAPKQVKEVFTQSGTSDKKDMKTSLLKHEDIIINKEILDQLSEHAIDAIGIGYAYLKNL